MSMPGFSAEASLLREGGHSHPFSVVSAPRQVILPQLDAATFFQPFGFWWLGQTGRSGSGSGTSNPRESCFKLCDFQRGTNELDCDTNYPRSASKRRACYDDARQERIECYFRCSG